MNSLPLSALNLVGVRAANKLVYLASPLSTYRTKRYREMFAYCQSTFAAEILEPKRLFSSSVEWRTNWPKVLACIDHLVFFSDGHPN